MYSLQRIVTSQLYVFKNILKKCSLELPFGTLSSGYLRCYFSKKEKNRWSGFSAGSSNSFSTVYIKIGKQSQKFNGLVYTLGFCSPKAIYIKRLIH